MSRLSPACRHHIPVERSGIVSMAPDTSSTVFRDAGVFMELADYAERNGLDFNRQLVRELHRDALQLRIAALKTFLIRAPLA
ncbi:hypothetical protein P8935_03860 [Telmatobacter sp. DSM 110680]|uniref:Uncharacterized protein n=1 Tax=Telmatobacter sp. DSM 110680 TaxID=3036704 RepID=A0AAU7DLE7_9BACT